ncbi:MAG: hypothetical protein IJ341_12715 [Bacteroidales bacterium]|nr:hypothetical protein [Bacteroidales bacterium]
MSNGLLNASGLTTPKVTTEEIILKGKPISDVLANESNVKIIAPHALGDFYFSITPYMPEGVLPLNGSEVSRTTYLDLYNYVLSIHNELVESGKKFIVTEEEWQNISIENNGYVPYYSYGTGDGLFRLPRMSGYLKATGEIDEAGNYVAEGLPNITSSKAPWSPNSGGVNGAFSFNTSAITYGVAGGDAHKPTYLTKFDASRSNSIYGNSEHVTPETNTLFVGVWALTAFTQVGTANLTEIKEILSQCETILGDSLPLLSSRYDNRGLETSSWKIGDGTWLDGRIYTEAYTKLIEKIAEGNSQYLEMKESELLSPIEFPENFLIDTEDIKFRLPISAGRQSIKVEYYAESGNSYEIFSDGWCIQRLRFVPVSGASASTLTFLLPFRDIKYSVRSTDSSNTPETDGTDTDGYEQNNAIDGGMTTTSFRVSHQPNRCTTFLIEGYITEGLLSSFLDTKQVYFKVSHGVDEGKINIEEKLTVFEETAYTRLNEIVEEVSKDYVVHVDKQVGELYFSFDNYCPDGVIPLDGRLVSRATYADLWQWVQEKGLVKDDALITTNDKNTVSIFNEDGTVKYCSWYGNGDGELTFRVPKINGYIKASGDNTLVGQYIQEGLPNLVGNINKAPTDYAVWSVNGVFSKTTDSAGAVRGGGGGEPKMTNINFNASRYNSIYGNSEHVTPETNTLFVGVWAITATKAAVFDMRDVEEALKSAESYLMNNVPLFASRWDRDGLGNLGWVKADGSWLDGRHYTGAYAKCVEHLVNGNDNFVDSQLAIINETNYDKFIVDRINKRFRLPITNGQRTWEEVQGLNNPTWVLYWKLAHEFYIPAQAEIQEKLDLIDNLVAKTDINLPTLSSRWDSDFAENVGWVKSEGHWLNGNVYRDAYDLMVSRIGINDKFVAATEGTELTDENADKFLIDTTAVKFRLPLVNGERILVASLKTDTVWYNYYSDGWLEQGGEVLKGVTTITYPKVFSNTKYYINRTSYGVSSSADGFNAYTGVGSSKTDTRTVSGVTWNSGDYTVGHIWQAKGKGPILNVSEYNRGLYLFFKLADEVPTTVVNTEQVISDMRQEVIEYKADMDAILALGNDYICGCMMPDYSTQTDIPIGTVTVIPYHSFATIEVRANHSSNTTSYDVIVNDTNVVILTSVGWDCDSFSLFIKKGDTIQIKNRGSGSSTSPVVRAYFYRLSGATVEETTE